MSITYEVTGWWLKVRCEDLDQVREKLYQMKESGEHEWFEVFVKVSAYEADQLSMSGIAWEGKCADLERGTDVLDEFETAFGRAYPLMLSVLGVKA